MLDHLSIVLCRPKFPENVGSAARACANFGCPNLVVVAPQLWDADRAASLATPKGREVLAHMRVEDDLEAALRDYHMVYATTARTGGWRKGLLTPQRMAEVVREDLDEGRAVRAAVVFGPEDRGLTNEEINLCSRLVCIPTSSEASSLNVASAALVVLYECFKSSLAAPFRPAGPPESRPVNHAEQEALHDALREMLLAIDFLKDDNTDYWMLPVKRLLARVGLKRNEFNLLMGICRQMRWAARRDG
ncbi:MAG: RNA methyltransferase [Desulfovibrionaceae bacterium]|nr:RNA methyltransferase [Desulfovibrionaceae bacterium]